jgi:hypothetical protein
MEEHSVSAPLTFTPKDGNKETNTTVYVRLISDGVHIPTFEGMIPRGDSEPFLNVAGKVNIVEFFYDGVDVWYVIHNELNPIYTSYTDESKPVIRHTGTLTQDEVWVSNAIHIIEDTLVIPEGITVTIEEGASVVASVLSEATQITSVG